MGLLVNEAHKKPLLQVALDFTELDTAINVALNVAKAGVDIIEIGTPLIKCCGLESIKRMKSNVNANIFLADLKTVDAYEYEFRPFILNGANAVTILGIVDDDIINDAVNLCKNLGADLVVDLIYIQNPVNRALKLAEIGVEVVSLHVGIDIQKKRGITAKELLKEIEEISSSDIIVSVAGGIKPSEISQFIEYGAKIIVIGSAITKSPDPYKSSLEAIEILNRYRT